MGEGWGRREGGREREREGGREEEVREGGEGGGSGRERDLPADGFEAGRGVGDDVSVACELGLRGPPRLPALPLQLRRLLLQLPPLRRCQPLPADSLSLSPLIPQGGIE